ncbi:holo-ACP synthase [Halobacteriales archaeon QS_1_69_70]|nr:MAG: holo-ACP synthase [Halobacteriales archaeon QS_1_69_70]
MTASAFDSRFLDSLPPGVHLGTDVVSISRIQKLIEEFGDSFLSRAFTRAEREYSSSQGHPAEHYASRWAAKEAFFKTCSEPTPGVPFDSIEVRKDEGIPSLCLSGPAATAARRIIGHTDGEPATAISLSHDRKSDHAIAVVAIFESSTNSSP